MKTTLRYNNENTKNITNLRRIKLQITTKEHQVMNRTIKQLIMKTKLRSYNNENIKNTVLGTQNAQTTNKNGYYIILKASLY